MALTRRNRKALYSIALIVIFVGAFTFADFLHNPPGGTIKTATPTTTITPTPNASQTAMSPNADPSGTTKTLASPLASSVASPKTTSAIVPIKPTATPVKITVSKGTTVTTKTNIGTQTLTVKTDRVKVGLSPSPSPSTTIYPTSVPRPTPAVLPPSNWDGFIAPKVTFDKLLSCVQSKEVLINPITGQSARPWLVNWQVKLHDGYFNYNGHLYTQSNVLYVPVSDTSVQMWNTDMNYTSGLWDTLTLYFMPLNWKNNASGDTADSTPKSVDYSYLFHSTQKECDSL